MKFGVADFGMGVKNHIKYEKHPNFKDKFLQIK